MFPALRGWAALAVGRGRAQIAGMSFERPPTTDAEFRVVHGPWPRWAVHLSLIKLIAWGAGAVGAVILLTLALLALISALD